MKTTLYIQPGAARTEVSGTHNGMVRIRVYSPPVGGAANKAVIEFIAETIGVPKSSVKIISGEKFRIKTVMFNENEAKYPEKIEMLRFSK